MGALCRAKAWEETPLGPVGGWSRSLKTVAGLVVCAPFPKIVLWGEQLVQIYNDGYRDVMGDKHPAGLGQPTRECWPEVWEFNAPIYEAVLNGAESFVFEDQRLVLYRHGYPEETFFSLAFSPVPDDDSEVGGILVSVHETTAQVRAREVEAERRQAMAALRDSESRFRALAELSPVATLIAARERIVYVNPAAVQLLGADTPEQLTSRSALSIVLPEFQDTVRERVRRAVEERRGSGPVELSVRRLDGEVVEVETANAPVMWEGGPALQVVLRDVTAQKRHERQLREAQQSLEVAVRAARMGVWDIDLKTMTARTSERHDEIFGYATPVGAWSPSSLQEHIIPEDRGLVKEAYERALRTGEFNLAARVRWDDGSIHWVHNQGRIYRDDGGTPVRMAGVAREITEEKHAEETLRLAKEAAERASIVKSQFLSTMSHELRTPLNAVIGLTDLMQGGMIGETSRDQRAHLGRIKASAWHLVGIIDEILGFTRSEAGKDEIRVTDVDIAQLSREVVDMLRHEAERLGLRLHLEGADEPLHIDTDGGKVRQVLTNLVGNALKYTEEGTVTVTLEDAERTVRLNVHDTGAGIPQDRLEDIFDPFVQVDSSMTRARGGTGLGLAISRRLARLLGGDVTVQSELGEGSTFTLRLPGLRPRRRVPERRSADRMRA